MREERGREERGRAERGGGERGRREGERSKTKTRVCVLHGFVAQVYSCNLTCMTELKKQVFPRFMSPCGMEMQRVVEI